MKNLRFNKTKQCRRAVTPSVNKGGKLHLLKSDDTPKFDWSIRSDLPIIPSRNFCLIVCLMPSGSSFLTARGRKMMVNKDGC